MKKFMSLVVLLCVGSTFGAEGQNNGLERMNIVGLPVVVVENAPQPVRPRTGRLVIMPHDERRSRVNPFGCVVINSNFQDKINPIKEYHEANVKS